VSSSQELPGELPEFDFNSVEQPYYDPEIIADEAVWPLVDELWRGDWRAEAFPGHVLHFPKSGMVAGKKVDVTITAEQSSAEEAGELLGEVEITIEEVVSGPERQFIIEAAHDDDPELMKSLDTINLAVKQAVSYAFNTAGEAEIDIYRLIEDPNSKDPFWVMGVMTLVDDEKFVNDIKFHDHDITALGDAFAVLGAPDDIIEDLLSIKDEPISPQQ
jgi:hypothetical protein